jgi:transcriptional regulator with XRE-family HTH domain
MEVMTEGKLLRNIRYELNLTQMEFAEKFGSSQQAITMIERGQREVPKSLIKALSDFGIDFYGSLNTGNIVRVENAEECLVEETYRLSLTAKIRSLSTVNKVMELLKDIEEISVFKVDEGYYQKQEV